MKLLRILTLASALYKNEAFMLISAKAPSPVGSKEGTPLLMKATSPTCDGRQEEGEEVEHQQVNRKQFFQITCASLVTSLLLPSFNDNDSGDNTRRMSFTPSNANAAYGDSSNMELPNYIDFLIEKNSSVDPSKILYKGTDVEVQMKRISDAASRLNEVPVLAAEKKWSQVQGILTGPLGTLIQTMGQVTKSVDSADAKKVAIKVKGDIILIGQEAAKKNEAGVVKACGEAQQDLEAFAKLVF